VVPDPAHILGNLRGPDETSRLDFRVHTEHVRICRADQPEVCVSIRRDLIRTWLVCPGKRVDVTSHGVRLRSEQISSLEYTHSVQFTPFEAEIELTTKERDSLVARVRP
jgi:hypothetical protein